MGRDTGISWTDHTFNPWWGCTRVSPGCDNCYAETWDKRIFPVVIAPATLTTPAEIGAAHWGKGSPRRILSDKYWRAPLKWNREAEKERRQHFVFCASMADVMDDEAPAGQRERLWELIYNTPFLTWQLLTKRPQRFATYLPRQFPHSNVILMTTTEDQDRYNLRWPILQAAADARGLKAGISYEPALGPLTMTGFSAMPDWIIFGGESGAERRPCNPQWARDLKDECNTFGVKLFVKQMSALTPAEGKALIPPELMFQEMP